jgi:hypothetical protein
MPKSVDSAVLSIALDKKIKISQNLHNSSNNAVVKSLKLRSF